MNSLYSFLCTTALILLLSPASCFSTDYPRGLLSEDKTRLGSSPPSCHNKCNECHPCMAVQVATIPSHDRVLPRPTHSMPMDFFDLSPAGNTNSYSNYKPLGWKCRCGNHFYNP